jgi:hypothetical protein
MVPEEVHFLVRYDELWKKTKQVVDMPDSRLANLLSKVHENGGDFPITNASSHSGS